MITQFAQMFSTNGVLLHGTRNVLVPASPNAKQVSAGSDSRPSGFNQAAAQLNLSPQALARMAAGTDEKNHGDKHGDAKDGADSSGGETRAADIGGHVDVDASAALGNSEATPRKAETAQQGDKAPGDSSGTDKAAAGAPASMASQATPTGWEGTDRNSRVDQAVVAYGNQESETGSSINAYA